MNGKLCRSVALILVFCAGAPGLALALSVGEAAPGFSLPGSGGEEISLSDFAGKVVVLEWTNHKCPFVRKHYLSGNIPNQQRIAAEKDIVWLSIISSAPGKQGHVGAEEAEEIARNWNAAPHQILFDESGEAGRSYRARTTPHIFLIGTGGELLYQGAIDSIDSADRADLQDAEQYLLSAIESLESGEEIAVSTTVPYGCSIKY